MRKIIFSILILLLAAQAWGQQGAVISGAVVVGAGVSAAAGKIGFDTQYSLDFEFGGVRMWAVTTTTAGVLTKGNVYVKTAGTGGTEKICLYPKTQADPNDETADNLIGCSNPITTSSAGAWNSSAVGTIGSITAATEYWLLIINSGDSGVGKYTDATGTVWYNAVPGTCYATPSTCLTTITWTSYPNEAVSFYLD